MSRKHMASNAVSTVDRHAWPINTNATFATLMGLTSLVSRPFEEEKGSGTHCICTHKIYGALSSTRKMISSGGVSLRSWYQLYSM
jgi:hypothetical protein